MIIGNERDLQGKVIDSPEGGAWLKGTVDNRLNITYLC